MKLAPTINNALLFLLPLTSLLAVAAPLNSRSDLANTDLVAVSAADLVISSFPTGDDSKAESLSEVDNNPDVGFVGGNEGTYNVYLRADEGEKTSVGIRQISPWPHFRECKKDDPRPECHHYKRIHTENTENSNVFAEEVETVPLEVRQISPWPHFRECKPNDPRAECSYYKKPRLSPWPHFWQCVKNDPRRYCRHNRRSAGFEGADFDTEATVSVLRPSKQMARNEHQLQLKASFV